MFRFSVFGCKIRKKQTYSDVQIFLIYILFQKNVTNRLICSTFYGRYATYCFLISASKRWFSVKRMLSSEVRRFIFASKGSPSSSCSAMPVNEIGGNAVIAHYI